MDPTAVDSARLGAADRFCALAVLHYTDADTPPRFAAAAELLRAQPFLVDVHEWAAAAAADPEALSRYVSRSRSAAIARGGPFDWPALLYLCFSRAPLDRPERDVLRCATILLDAGADPDSGYLWRGTAPPFTALTAVFGEGEQGPRRQPRHPYAPALARLLLDRGANPVDQQGLYNRMFRADDSHLEVLFAHGLADAGPNPWEVRLGAAMEPRARMWRRQVEWAAAHGFGARLDLLARHGIDVSGVQMAAPATTGDPHSRDETGATPLHHAAWDGDLGEIRRLLDAGADHTAVDHRFGATAHGWAEYAFQTEAADMLRSTDLLRSEESR